MDGPAGQRCRDILSAFDASRGFLEIPTRCPSIPPAMLFLLWDQTADGLLAEPYRLVSGKMAPYYNNYGLRELR